MADKFGLHELAVEDAVHAHQRPKLDRYAQTSLFMVSRRSATSTHESPTTANEIVETGEIMVFLGGDFIVTVRHGEHSGLRRAAAAAGGRAGSAAARTGGRAARHRRPRGRPLRRGREAFEDDIDDMERGVRPRQPVGAEQMYLMKREILELRRAVMPLATPLRRLTEGYTPLVPDRSGPTSATSTTTSPASPNT